MRNIKLTIEYDGSRYQGWTRLGKDESGNTISNKITEVLKKMTEEDDLELLWEAIINMFENDHSAARGKMAVRRLIVFKHSKELGDCPAYKLFDAVDVTKKEEVEYPRRYQDYVIKVYEDKIPSTVEVMEKI